MKDKYDFSEYFKRVAKKRMYMEYDENISAAVAYDYPETYDEHEKATQLNHI